MATITIRKKDKILKGEIALPASKSISNRALIIQYLSGGKLKIKNLSNAEDTKLMYSLLRKIESQPNSSETTNLDCQNAGTVFRFLTAYLSLKPGRWLLTGSERMKMRPIGPLVKALQKLGASISYLEQENFPPLLIEGKSFPGGSIETDSSISSQFITALLLIAPALPGGLKLKLTNNISSVPYIEMTIKLLNICGIKSNFSNNTITISQQEFAQTELTIEPDWSSASYWYSMAAFAKESDLVLKSLKKESQQGDSILPEIFANFGVKTEYFGEGIRLTRTNQFCSSFEFDFSNYPDLAQTVIVTCAGLNIPSIFTGLESLRIKETDRIAALYNELKKVGFSISVNNDSELRIQPLTQTLNLEPVSPTARLNLEPGTLNLEPGTLNHLTSPYPPSKGEWTLNLEPQTLNLEPIHTYNDHRMAMAFAPLAMILGSVKIENPQVVSKSYPGFWDDLKIAEFIIEE